MMMLEPDQLVATVEDFKTPLPLPLSRGEAKVICLLLQRQISEDLATRDEVRKIYEALQVKFAYHLTEPQDTNK